MTTFYETQKTKKFKSQSQSIINNFSHNKNNNCKNLINTDSTIPEEKFIGRRMQKFRVQRISKTINLPKQNKDNFNIHIKSKERVDENVNTNDSIEEERVRESILRKPTNLTKSSSTFKSSNNLYRIRASRLLNLNKDLVNEDNLNSLTYMNVIYICFIIYLGREYKK